jgi:hypothetical protein
VKQTQDRAGGIEPFDSVIAPEQKAREVAAIYVTQPLQHVVVFGEKERGVSAGARVFVKELIDGSQELLWLIQSDGALAAQICLEVGHQKRGGDALSCNVANHQTQAFPS